MEKTFLGVANTLMSSIVQTATAGLGEIQGMSSTSPWTRRLLKGRTDLRG